jgi:hypothetical protein
LGLIARGRTGRHPARGHLTELLQRIRREIALGAGVGRQTQVEALQLILQVMPGRGVRLTAAFDRVLSRQRVCDRIEHAPLSR